MICRSKFVKLKSKLRCFNNENGRNIFESNFSGIFTIKIICLCRNLPMKSAHLLILVDFVLADVLWTSEITLEKRDAHAVNGHFRPKQKNENETVKINYEQKHCAFIIIHSY